MSRCVRGGTGRLGARTQRRRVMVTMALAVLLGPLVPLGVAVAADVPVQIQALLFLKALAYDHNIKDRANKTVQVAILYKPGAAESERAAQGIHAAMSDAAKKSNVAGMPLTVMTLPYQGPQDLDRQMARLGTTALFVCPELGSAIPYVAAVTRKRHVLSGGGGEDYARAGLTIAFTVQGNKPALLVNLPASRAEGLALDSGLLRVAHVIK